MERPAPEPIPEHLPPDDGAPRPDGNSFPFASWGPWAALGVTLLALFTGLLISAPFLLVDGADQSEDLADATVIAIQACTAIGFILIPILFAMTEAKGLRAGLGMLGFRSFRPGQALAWAAAGIGVYLAFALLYAGLVGTPEQEDVTERFGSVAAQWILIVIAAPIGEEICFRGLLFGGLRNRFPLWAAALMAGLFFGLLHYSTGWSAVPPLIFLGAVFAVIYEKTESLWPPIIIHMANNAIALAILGAS